MPLIPSPRHTEADLRAWESWSRMDRRAALDRRLTRREVAAMGAIAAFVEQGPCYVGVSWGKDSVVVAHLARRLSPTLPLVWVRLDPYDNPDCHMVRDAFLAEHPGAYEEIVVNGPPLEDGWLPTGARHPGYAEAAERYGDRYVSGVRADESRTRRLRARRHGVSTTRTCAPITRWSGGEVFAYLERHKLPVHPAYACTHGGLLDRTRVRVASLCGLRGTGHGRRQWEEQYYREEVAALLLRDIP